MMKLKQKLLKMIHLKTFFGRRYCAYNWKISKSRSRSELASIFELKSDSIIFVLDEEEVTKLLKWESNI